MALAGVALAAPVPAHAAKRWIGSRTEQSTVTNCTSIILGAPRQEIGAVANAEFFADRNRLPRVGQAFYVRTQPGAVGRPCANQSVTVELVLPAGVRTAISRRRPVRCSYIDIQTRRATRVTAGQGCPQRTGNGVYGRSLNRTGSQGPVWNLPYGQSLSIEVPLRSSRRLKGIGGPSCPRKAGDPPCFPKDVRQNAVFAVHVLDGDASPWLAPYVPLFVRPVAR